MSPGETILLVTTWCSDTTSNFLCFNFCNIRGLEFNFQSMRYRVTSSKPHFSSSLKPRCLLISSSWPAPSYSIIFFECCVNVNNDIICSRTHGLEYSEFSTWLTSLEVGYSLWPRAISALHSWPFLNLQPFILLCQTVLSAGLLWSYFYFSIFEFLSL